jgi:glycosyltransferase involved in cell wall biosynthesis
VKHVDKRTAKEVDICLLLEGTYPFVQSGVSNWVYELIRVFPQYRFAVIFLGTKAEDYSEPCYPLAKNLVHLEMHYLFEDKHPPKNSHQDIDADTLTKIVNIHNNFDSNAQCPELLKLLEDDDHLNEALFLRSKSAWQFIVERYSNRCPNQSFFDYFWGVRNLHYPFWTLKKIINQVPKFKILHSASTGYAGFLGALLQEKYAVPYILTEHGIYTKERWIELMRNYFFMHMQKESKAFIHDDALLQVWLRFFKTLGHIAYDHANPIISLTEEYRQRQIHDGALTDKTKIISYGIDFEHYAFLNKKRPNQDKPIIACVGRIVPIKDIKTFIRACAVIIEKIPAAEAWIVGSLTDAPEYVAACKNLIEIFGLESKLKFLGTQNVMHIFPKIDLLIVSSISEGSPFVMLESLAVGIPIIATDVGGCGELIHGKSPADKALGAAGALVSIADPSGMGKAAVGLLQDTSAWLSAQQAGLARVKKYYGMKKLIKTYGLIYEEAISHGRNRV